MYASARIRQTTHGSAKGAFAGLDRTRGIYESHWSFQPLRVDNATDPPEFTAESPEANHQPIDRWIREKWSALDLRGSPQAPLRTLLRRVYLDLIGLPPSLEELASFERDWEVRGEAAYVEAVDRLLHNPHYGERWGRWWLDQARYADSHGYSVDAPREIWLYRDWVVAAFNRDLPFDQFAIEQLAGDLLPNASDDQHIATGFHRNTQINQEGGVDPEQFRIESLFDRVATTGTVFLGLSIGCAQCHDHKFDPFRKKNTISSSPSSINKTSPKGRSIRRESMEPRSKKRRKR